MFSRINEALLKLMARAPREEGQTLTEYGLIIALVSIALVGGLTALALGITGVFNDIVSNF